MQNGRIITTVHRAEKRGTKALQHVMILFAVCFLILGILFNRGMFLPCFLMASLYFYFHAHSASDYEYQYENGRMAIDVIKGGNTRITEHVLDLGQMVILAPHDAPEVARYRKGGEEGHLPKYDYTSYDESVPYYTMIIYENKRKIKLLLDLKEDMLHQIYVQYPQKIILQFVTYHN